MAQVETLEIEHNFQEDVVNQAAGRAPIDAKKLDQILALVAENQNLINENLKMLQRDDGQLNDAVVGPAQMQRSLLNLVKEFNLRGAYIASTYYAKNDAVDYNGSLWVCSKPHNSTSVFVESNWLRYGASGAEDVSVAAQQAQQAATVAVASLRNANTAAATAETLKTQTEAAAVNATNAASSAAAQANQVAQNTSIASSARARSEAAALRAEAAANSSGITNPVAISSANLAVSSGHYFTSGNAPTADEYAVITTRGNKGGIEWIWQTATLDGQVWARDSALSDLPSTDWKSPADSALIKQNFTSAVSNTAALPAAVAIGQIVQVAKNIDPQGGGSYQWTGSEWELLNNGAVNLAQFGGYSGADAAINDAALTAALAYVKTHKCALNIGPGEWAFTQSRQIDFDLELNGTPSTIIQFNSDKDKLWIDATGSLSALPKIQNAAKGNTSVTFTAAHGLAVGDWFLIFNPTDYSWSNSRSYYKAGEWCKVCRVNGNEVVLSNHLYDSYVGADVDIYKVTSPKVKITNISGRGYGYGLINLNLIVGAELHNVGGIMTGHTIIMLERCIDFNITAAKTHNIGLAEGTDYGYGFANCQHGRMFGGDLFARRHAITIGGKGSIGCVSCRDIIVTGAVIRNDVESNTHSADWHGNSEKCFYINCTIYGGAIWQGQDNGLIDCNIYNRGDGALLDASEIRGGAFTVKGVKFASYINPQPSSRAYINVGMNNITAINSNIKTDITLELIDCEFDLPSSAAATTLVGFRNNGATVKVNFIIDNIRGKNIAAMNAILSTRTDSGTSNSSFIIIDNLKGFPSGIILHSALNSHFLNVPHRLQRQTGIVKLSSTVGGVQTVAAPITLAMQYPRQPAAFTGRIGVNTSTVGGKTTNADIYQANNSTIRPMIRTADSTAWTAAEEASVSWSTELREV